MSTIRLDSCVAPIGRSRWVLAFRLDRRLTGLLIMLCDDADRAVYINRDTRLLVFEASFSGKIKFIAASATVLCFSSSGFTSPKYVAGISR
jgi:hypothetical protein